MNTHPKHTKGSEWMPFSVREHSKPFTKLQPKCFRPNSKQTVIYILHVCIKILLKPLWTTCLSNMLPGSCKDLKQVWNVFHSAVFLSHKVPFLFTLASLQTTQYRGTLLLKYPDTQAKEVSTVLVYSFIRTERLGNISFQGPFSDFGTSFVSVLLQ